MFYNNTVFHVLLVGRFVSLCLIPRCVPWLPPAAALPSYTMNNTSSHHGCRHRVLLAVSCAAIVCCPAQVTHIAPCLLHMPHRSHT